MRGLRPERIASRLDPRRLLRSSWTLCGCHRHLPSATFWILDSWTTLKLDSNLTGFTRCTSNGVSTFVFKNHVQLAGPWRISTASINRPHCNIRFFVFQHSRRSKFDQFGHEHFGIDVANRAEKVLNVTRDDQIIWIGVVGLCRTHRDFHPTFQPGSNLRSVSTQSTNTLQSLFKLVLNFLDP